MDPSTVAHPWLGLAFFLVIAIITVVVATLTIHPTTRIGTPPPNRPQKGTRMEPTIQLGDVARDTITGFTGVVIARTEWLHGCWRLILQSQLLKDGKPVEGQTFDVEQLELVAKRGHVANKETGGPRPDAVRR